MAARNLSRVRRSRRNHGASRRPRWCLLPLLESLETRVLLSTKPTLPPPAVTSLLPAGSTPIVAAADGLIPVRLASGKIGWLEASAASRLTLPGSSGSSLRIITTSQDTTPADPGGIYVAGGKIIL
jgi:hypothetical protein